MRRRFIEAVNIGLCLLAILGVLAAAAVTWAVLIHLVFR